MNILIKTYDTHPYICSFFVAVIMSALALFTPKEIQFQTSTNDPNKMDFVNIEKMQEKPRQVKKKVDPKAKNPTPKEQVERSEGTSLEKEAVDLAAYPNVVKPRLKSALPNLYPKEAKKREVEASLYLDILLDRDGKVRKVELVGAKLNKELPKNLKDRLVQQFYEDAQKMLSGAQYSPPVVDGKNVAVRMRTRLTFDIES